MSRGDEKMKEILMQYYDNEQMRRDLAVDLLTRSAFNRMVAIGKGEEPPVGPDPEPEIEEEAVEAEAEADAAPEAEDAPAAEAEAEEAPAAEVVEVAEDADDSAAADDED
jgi:hypothetical protein